MRRSTKDLNDTATHELVALIFKKGAQTRRRTDVDNTSSGSTRLSGSMIPFSVAVEVPAVFPSPPDSYDVITD